MPLSHDVHIFEIRTNSWSRADGTTGQSHTARWRVEGKDSTFTNKALTQVKGHVSKLRTAMGRGEAFDTVTGLPPSMARQAARVSVYELAVELADRKWPMLAPKTRGTVAGCLVHAIVHTFDSRRGMPDVSAMSVALTRWSLNSRSRRAIRPPARIAEPVRGAAKLDRPPAELAPPLIWIARHSIEVGTLEDPEKVRGIVRAMQYNLDGSPASKTTYARRRGCLYELLQLAVVRGALPVHPMEVMERVPFSGHESESVVDPDCIATMAHGRALVQGAKELPGRYRGRLAGPISLMYWAGLRPEEWEDLRLTDLALPEADGEYGEVILAGADPQAQGMWMDEGQTDTERSPLKHRSLGAVRRVPLDPECVRDLKWSIDRFPPDPETGRLFTGPHKASGPIPRKQWLENFRKIRELAGVPEMVVPRPYWLRHACVSRWIAAGVALTDVAYWAGHSVAVLQATYAKVIGRNRPMMLARLDAAKREEDLMMT